MKNGTLVFLFFAVMAPAASAFEKNIPGFRVAVECDARLVNPRGYPQDVSSVVLGVHIEGGEKSYLAYAGDKLVGAFYASLITPDSSGRLESELTSKDFDFGYDVYQGTVKIQFDNNGVGTGAMESAAEPAEPYVLGSLVLTNCRLR